MRKYFAAAAADQYSQCGTKCFKVEEKERKSEMVAGGGGKRWCVKNLSILVCFGSVAQMAELL